VTPHENYPNVVKCRCPGVSVKIGKCKWVANLWRYNKLWRNILHSSWQIEKGGKPRNHVSCCQIRQL